jgi:predicted metal-dependent HD superfamily phosphohydrolase
MTAPEAELRVAWQRFAGDEHAELLEHLLARLREPHRSYHTATHVAWVLRHIDHIAAAGLPASVDLPVVRLAALYHDAVYLPTRSDNEAVSAKLASAAATALGWSSNRVSGVERLVLATAGHSPTALDEDVLVDADLAILGSGPKDYTAYVQGVRAEYSHVPEDHWRTGRAEVIRRFLDTPTLFHTAVMHDEREQRARANLSAELASLR